MSFLFWKVNLLSFLPWFCSWCSWRCFHGCGWTQLAQDSTWRTHTHTYTHTYTHTPTRTHTHTRTHTLGGRWKDGPPTVIQWGFPNAANCFLPKPSKYLDLNWSLSLSLLCFDLSFLLFSVSLSLLFSVSSLWESERKFKREGWWKREGEEKERWKEEKGRRGGGEEEEGEPGSTRSEERSVGEECRCRWSPDH